MKKPNEEPSVRGVTFTSEMFGKFKAEHWEANEYVITCKLGVIGPTLGKHEAWRVQDWLNAAFSEAMMKLASESK